MALAAILAAGIATAVILIVTGGDEAHGQTVRFQAPTDPGPAPFTPPSDTQGKEKVTVGSGPYGGTGSDLVCDRELLIRSLRAQPDRLATWAAVEGITPTYQAVARYIRGLTPVTLTQDTRVTNHSFVGGRATAFQAILQAGTAVLVDRNGIPRARCRCGNPLLEPVYYPQLTCLYCPPRYTPPAPCSPYSECYTDYPDPPQVLTKDTTPPQTAPKRQPPPQSRPPPQTTTQPTQTQQQEPPSASFSPQTGHRGDSFTLSISGFSPNTDVSVTLQRPDGQNESYSIHTDSSGRGAHDFPPTGSNTLLGTYTATVFEPGTTGRSASASATLIQ